MNIESQSEREERIRTKAHGASMNIVSWIDEHGHEQVREFRFRKDANNLVNFLLSFGRATAVKQYRKETNPVEIHFDRKDN